MLSYLQQIIRLLKPISPVDCLIRKIEQNNLIEALLCEDKEFYCGVTQHSEQYYGKRLNEQDWRCFLSNLKITDELWFFKFPLKYWKKSHGCQGYAIVRNGRLVDSIITHRN